jgi:hypothetical protein
MKIKELANDQGRDGLTGFTAPPGGDYVCLSSD